MRKKRIRRWLTGLLAAAVLFTAVDLSLSRLMASGRAHRLLTARLAQQFGRDVEVGRFDLRWLPTPGIVASQVTIGEDPRFGNEYFLRAQSVVASPRWGALLAGRLEIGTLQFSQPSLNLVRNPDGRWNVESWLPPPSTSGTKTGFMGPRAPRVTAKLFRIVIDGGRINFSQGVDRRPFALVDLAGSIEQERPGVWGIALAARPQRATVHLQNSGTLRLSGHIAGTSARLQPANLDLTWSDASLVDALRLAMGRDPGVRGGFNLQMTARTEQFPAAALPTPAQWAFSFSARVDGLHRWDMPSLGDNPTVSVQAEAAWKAGAPQVELSKLLVQAPQSSIEGAGSVDWSRGFQPEMSLTSNGIAFDDLFAWYRSFQPGVADGLAAAGFFSADAHLGGWPLNFESGQLGSDGVAIKMAGAPWAVSGPILVRAGGARVELSPVTLIFGGSDIAVSRSSEQSLPARLPGERLTVLARLTPPRPIGARVSVPTAWGYEVDLRGDFAHLERMLAAARDLGRPLNSGWDAEGGLEAHLNWQWKSGERFPRPTGQITTRAFILRVPALNQPVEVANAKIELLPGELRVTISEASALGGHWQGTISRRDSLIAGGNAGGARGAVEARVATEAPLWEFDLASDRLDPAELDRWIGPRARPGWLARLFSQAGSTPPQFVLTGPLGQLHARGSLRVDTFALDPLDFQKLHAQIELLGRSIDVSQFDARAYGGSISGRLLASLEADPTYWMRATVSNVSATELAAANPALERRVVGQLSGDVRFSMHGIGRDSLLNSMEGDGHFSATQAVIRGMGFATVADEPSRSETEGPFSLVNAEFTIAARQFKFPRIALLSGKEYFEGSGTADFDRVLHFDFGQRPVAAHVTKLDERLADRVIRVTGLLEAPRVTSEPLPVGASQPAQQSTTQPITQGAPRATRPSSKRIAPPPTPKSAPVKLPSQPPSQPPTRVARH